MTVLVLVLVLTRLDARCRSSSWSVDGAVVSVLVDVGAVVWVTVRGRARLVPGADVDGGA